jgi:predicted regulator of Ras-like GTPase activity (Roadblock/LC7/MglB family)
VNPPPRTVPEVIVDFKIILTALMERVDGATAAFFCGTDGIGVENITVRPDIEATVTEVELATALKVVNDAAQNLAVGKVIGLVFETEKITILIEKVRDDYFLCLLLNPAGNVGRGRIELKKLAAKVSREI